MKKVTKLEEREALLKSIAKWDLIAHGIVAEDELDCALFGNLDCTGCPVMKKTGKDGCINTPYDDTNLEGSIPLYEDFRENPNDPPNFDAVEREIEFLISLLPLTHKLRQL